MNNELIADLRALLAEWREREPILEDAKNAVGVRSFEFYRWRIWLAFAFWRKPLLDPHAIGRADGYLEAADELEAVLKKHTVEVRAE